MKYIKYYFLLEETFWVFTEVIERLLPLNYFTELVGMMTDYTLIKNLILRNNEEIIIHLKNLNCELYLNNMIHKWLITLFIEGVSEIFSFNYLGFIYVRREYCFI